MNSNAIPTRPITAAQRRELQRGYELAGGLHRAGRTAEAFQVARNCLLNDPDNRLYVERLLSVAPSVAVSSSPRSPLSTRFLRWLETRHLRQARRREDWQTILHRATELLGEARYAGAIDRIGLLSLLAEADRASECFEAELAWLIAAESLLSECREASLASDHDMLTARAVRIRQRLALAYLRLGDLELAVAMYQPDQSIPQIAEQDTAQSERQRSIEVRINRSPEDVANYLELAEHFSRTRQFDHAERTLQSAWHMEPTPTVAVLMEEVRLEKARHRVEQAKNVAAALPGTLSSNAGADGQLNEKLVRGATASAIARLEEDHLRVSCDIYRARHERNSEDQESRYKMAECLASLCMEERALSIINEFPWSGDWAAKADALRMRCANSPCT